MAATDRATDRGDSPAVICSRTKPSSAARSSASGGTPRAGGESRQRGEIARVALERVRGEPALDAQMIQIGVDHGESDTIGTAEPGQPPMTMIVFAACS